MMEASTSAERVPLVQPAYVFHSSLARRYQKRLRHFQCALCVGMLAALGIALLVTISYNLSEDPADNSTTPAAPAAPVVNLTRAAPDLAPMLNLTWPLKAKPPTPWITSPPTAAAVSAAVSAGAQALRSRRSLERARPPLRSDTPAGRAQWASATAGRVKPWADAAYAAEEATRHLTNGTDASTREGGVGQGPPTNATDPPYCRAEVPDCPPDQFRSIDGTCNNLAHPLRWGVANTPFRRVLPADYADGISAPRVSASGGALPSARDVSVTVHRPSYARDTTFTVMLAVWGQFIDHDITATALSKGENSTALSCCSPSAPAHPECFPVPLDAEDPYYQEYRLTCMEFVRAAPAVTCHFGPREQLNQATSYLDASVIYSPSPAKARQLRALEGGRLRMLAAGGRDLLPVSTDPDDGCNTEEMAAKGRYCFDSGDARANENLHLTTMHLLWARQHNRLAAALGARHPAWPDELLYQTARKIVAAQLQHITYNEFVPSILGDDVMWALNLTLLSAGRWRGYDPRADASVANHFAAAAFRFAHTLLPGLIHNVDLMTGSVSYTRLHDMLFNPYALYGAGGARGAVRGAAQTPLRGAEPHVTAELTNHLFERATNATPARAAAPCGLDLVSLNIQRGRDHGLPPYPAWRALCGAPRPRTFDDLREVFNELSWQRIVAIYESVDDIDLYTGALAEAPRGRLLGPTLTCLIADQFLRLKVGDRFWYETDDELTGFTMAQLTELRKTTLAGVICANEQLLDQVQPRVMQAAAGTNPLVDCAELPQPDLAAW